MGSAHSGGVLCTPTPSPQAAPQRPWPLASAADNGTAKVRADDGAAKAASAAGDGVAEVASAAGTTVAEVASTADEAVAEDGSDEISARPRTPPPRLRLRPFLRFRAVAAEIVADTATEVMSETVMAVVADAVPI